MGNASLPTSTATGTSPVSAINTIAIGNSARGTRNYAVAIGSGAVANKRGSVAIGQGSVANVTGTVSVGSSGSERRIMNVAAGVNATDAVNLGQLQAAVAAAAATTAAPTTAAAEGANMQQEMTALRAVVIQLQQEIAELKRDKLNAARASAQ